MVKVVALVAVLLGSCKRSEAPAPPTSSPAHDKPRVSAPLPPADTRTPDKAPDASHAVPSLTKVTPVGSLAASALAAEFDSNRIRASQMYVGKVFEIHGRLSSAEDDPDGPYLMLGNASQGVLCRIARSDLPTVAGLLPHSEVTVKGLITGKTNHEIRCRSCASATVYVDPCVVAKCLNIDQNCLPEIAYVDTQGYTYTASSLAGKVVIVSLCATWVQPCRQWLPKLANIYKKFKIDEVVVLSVITDALDDQALLQFQLEGQISPAIVRSSRDILTAFNYPPTVPTILVFDRGGKPAFRNVGSLQEENLISLLRKLLVQ